MAYAAPEQWRGTPAASLDGRTDLYALGGLLYEMLTGQTPFHAENYEGWSRQHQTTPPPPPSTLRPDLANWQGLDALTLRLLAKDRNDRPKDVAELLSLIDAVRYIAPDARRETVLEDAGKRASEKRSRRVSVWVWVTSFAMLFVLAFATVRVFAPQPSKPPTSTELQSHPQEKMDISAGLVSKASDTANQHVPSPPTGYIPVSPVGPSKPSINKPGIDQKPKPALEEDIKPPASKPEVPQEPKPAQEEEAKPAVLKPADAQIPAPVQVTRQKIEQSEIEQKAYELYKHRRYDEALAIFYQACKAGSADDCNYAGLAYSNINRSLQDPSYAVELFTTACNMGNAGGCNSLGVMYHDGRGVKRDSHQAVTLYSKACDMGSAGGCFNFGESYRTGDGVQKDKEKAKLLLGKGCSMGDQEGCDKLKKLR
jgi:hypothetical protein